MLVGLSVTNLSDLRAHWIDALCLSLLASSCLQPHMKESHTVRLQNKVNLLPRIPWPHHRKSYVSCSSLWNPSLNGTRRWGYRLLLRKDENVKLLRNPLSTANALLLVYAGLAVVLLFVSQHKHNSKLERPLLHSSQMFHSSNKQLAKSS